MAPTSFTKPTDTDLARMVANLVEVGKADIAREALQVEATFTKGGSYGSSRMVFALERAISSPFERSLGDVMRLVAEFHRHHGLPLDALIQTVEPSVEELAQSAIQFLVRGRRKVGSDTTVADAGARLRKRISDAVADVQVGYIAGRSAEMPQLTAREESFRLLKAIYDEARRDFQLPVNFLDVGGKIGMRQAAAEAAHSYLTAMHLIEDTEVGGGVNLTSSGIAEVEQAVQHPEQPTSHFPPVVNVLNIHQMIGSQVQQGTVRSSLVVEFSSPDLVQLRAFVGELESHKTLLASGNEKLAELEAEIGTLKAQLSKAKPNSTIIGEALRSVRSIAEGVIAGALTEPTINRVLQLLRQLGF